MALRGAGAAVEDALKAAFLEKWVPVDGEMKAVIAFSLFRYAGQAHHDPDPTVLQQAENLDLRCTCASLLLSNGVPMKQIQVWLGHSTFSTAADIYVHLDFSDQEQSAAAMNAMFQRKEVSAE